MGIINNRYDGFTYYRDLLEYINKKNIGYIENIKVVEIDGQYYGVAMETPNKQFSIGKDVVCYRDGSGYSIFTDTQSFSLPYKIESYVWSSFTSKLYDEYLEEVRYIKLYHIKNNEIIEVTNPINCFFLILLNSFIDKYYTKEEFDYYDYSSYKNIQIMKRDLLNSNEINVVSINPFKSKVKIEYKKRVQEVKYKAIVNVSSNKTTGQIYHTIVGFNINPIIEFSGVDNNINESNHVNSNEGIKLNYEYISNLKECNVDIILKIFGMGEEYIKILAENTAVELDEKTINSLVSGSYNIKTYLDNVSKKSKNKIVSKNYEAIKYIDNPTETIMRIAIEGEYSSIAKINNLTIDMYDKLINEYEESIQYIDEMNIEFQEYILNRNINNIKYFKSISKEIMNKFSDKIKIDMLNNNNIKREFLRTINSNFKEDIKRDKKNSLIYEKITQNYVETIKSLNYNRDYNKAVEIVVVNPDEPLNMHLEILENLIECNKFEIATGFLYSSGLYLINNIIEKLLEKNKEVNIIVGSLREYEFGNVINMDKNTAEYLNLFIDDGVKIKTYIEKFYHGKLYLIHGKELSTVIVGSSNVSNGGFYNNYETNIVMIFDNYSQKLNEFKDYFIEIWNKSNIIDKLDLNRFIGENVQLKDSDNTKKLYDVREEIKRQFSYLIEENPDSIIENVQTFEGQAYEGEYCAFYFERLSNLLILESLKYENAIYIFKDVYNLDCFLKKLKNKEASTNIENYVNRINHIKDASHISRVKDIIYEFKQMK